MGRTKESGGGTVITPLPRSSAVAPTRTFSAPARCTLPRVKVLIGKQRLRLVEILQDKTCLIFGALGAFTPESEARVKGFTAQLEKYTKYVDSLACLCVNDPYVLKAWAKHLNLPKQIVLVADWNAKLASSLGVKIDESASYMGQRASSFAALVAAGTVQWICSGENASPDKVAEFLASRGQTVPDDKAKASRPRVRISHTEETHSSLEETAGTRKPLRMRLPETNAHGEQDRDGVSQVAATEQLSSEADGASAAPGCPSEFSTLHRATPAPPTSTSAHESESTDNGRRESDKPTEARAEGPIDGTAGRVKPDETNSNQLSTLALKLEGFKGMPLSQLSALSSQNSGSPRHSTAVSVEMEQPQSGRSSARHLTFGVGVVETPLESPVGSSLVPLPEHGGSMSLSESRHSSSGSSIRPARKTSEAGSKGTASFRGQSKPRTDSNVSNLKAEDDSRGSRSGSSRRGSSYSRSYSRSGSSRYSSRSSRSYSSRSSYDRSSRSYSRSSSRSYDSRRSGSRSRSSDSRRSSAKVGSSGGPSKAAAAQRSSAQTVSRANAPPSPSLSPFAQNVDAKRVSPAPEPPRLTSGTPPTLQATGLAVNLWT